MKRRDLLTSVLVAGIATPVIGDQKRGKEENEGHGGHGDGERSDRLNNVAVSFGHWRPTPVTAPIDRFAPNDPNPRTLNGHLIIPNPVRIRVGDTVSFIISGFHNVVIYGPGTQPEDIDRTNVILSTPPPSFPPLINDPRNRVYRGLDPRTQGVGGATQDRVEVVGFTTPGKYLVICGVLPHFFDAATGEFVMFGYVDVRRDD
jgi:plastocyanin